MDLDPEAELLSGLVEAELSRSGKLTVVGDDKTRKAARELCKESHKAERRDGRWCLLGAEVSANSLLTVDRSGSWFVEPRPSADLFVRLRLLDAESGAIVASHTASWNPKTPEASSAEAVAGLLASMRRESLELPTTTRR